MRRRVAKLLPQTPTLAQAVARDETPAPPVLEELQPAFGPWHPEAGPEAER
jgi:hypothetical protein